MKRMTLITILVILISLMVVTPVFAGGGGPYKQPCYMDWHPRLYGFWVRNDNAAGAGNPYGPYVLGNYQACREDTPKAWWK